MPKAFLIKLNSNSFNIINLRYVLIKPFQHQMVPSIKHLNFCQFDLKIIIKKMYLIPLNQPTIYFNSTQLTGVTFLQLIYLLAIAYHPEYSSIMYLLYGSTHEASNSSKFGNLFLMVRDSGYIMRNTTLPSSLKCNVNCSIKVTQYLFLFQSQMNIVIYPLDTSSHMVIFTSKFARIKSNFSGLSNYSKRADIHKDKFVFVNQSHSLFGSTNDLLYSFPMNLYPQEILDIGMSDDWIFGAINATNVTLVFHTCVECIYNGSLGNNSVFVNNQAVLRSTNLNIVKSFRLYQGYKLENPGILNGRILWVVGDGISQKYLANETGSVQLQVYNRPSLISSSTANNYYFLLYGYDTSLIQREFVQITSARQFNPFYFSYTITEAAISNDSQRIAIHDSADTWNVRQYQLVQNCSLYNATVINGTLFCVCNQYNGDECLSLQQPSSSSSSSSSFPIIGVIGVVAGLITITITILLIKKYYKKCTKRHRTPWKYNPVQLMSFQI